MSKEHKEDGTKPALSDEEWRKLLKPAPTREQVVEILQSSYYAAAPPTPLTSNNSSSSSSSNVHVLKQLDSYDDVNYMVKMDETIYLLKIHNGLESRQFLHVLLQQEAEAPQLGGDYYKKGHMNSAIHLQNAILSLLASSSSSSSATAGDGGGNIVTSQPIVSTTTTSTTSSSSSSSPGALPRRRHRPSPVCIHSLPVASANNSPQDLVVRLLSWVPGRTMSSVKSLPLELLADAGRYLGKMDHILDTFNNTTAPPPPPPPAAAADDCCTTTSASRHDNVNVVVDESLWIPARRFHAWDGKNTLQLRKFVHYIPNNDARRRIMISSIINAFQHDILTPGINEQFRQGVNHGDYNDANILVTNDNETGDLRVSGVLDFGDSVESWRVLEITTAMAYGMLSSYGKANRGISAAAAVLRGYNSVYPLTSLERQHLVLLMTCRLACSATLGAYTYSQNPGNTYLLLHSEPAWKALEMIWCGNDTARRLQMKAAMNRVFDQACSYKNTTHEDGQEVIPCFDLVCPDPSVVDLLSSVRVVDNSSNSSSTDNAAASSATTEPLAKKPKSTINKNNEDNFNGHNGNLPLVTFVTGNAKKLEEVKRILQTTNGDDNDSHDIDDDDASKNTIRRLAIHLVNQSLDLPELQGDDVLAIAREKCLVASQQVNCGGSAVIIEDTSLCFNALNGLPGPYIKWFLDSCGHDGLNRMLAGFEDKTAYAQTVVAYCPARRNSTTPITMADVVVFSGRTNGTIVPARGKLDFGWDPIFEPLSESVHGDNGSDGNAKKTYAEMTKDEKDSISHRSRAFAQLREYLFRLYSNDDNKT